MEKEQSKRKPRIRRSSPSLREQREKAVQQRHKPAQPSRLNRASAPVRAKLSTAAKFLGKEYYLPLPEGRVWNFLNKRRYWIPNYVKESWRELRQVTWPGRRETWRLTLAVFIFAIIFGILVTVVDKGLEVVFKNLILE